MPVLNQSVCQPAFNSNQLLYIDNGLHTEVMSLGRLLLHLKCHYNIVQAGGSNHFMPVTPVQ